MDESGKTKQVINKIVEKLKTDYGPQKIILFGSHAYGKPDIESDLDLLIIKDTPEPFHKRWADVYELVSDIVKGVDFSPFVVTPTELERRIKIGDQFFKGIIEKGECLYAR